MLPRTRLRVISGKFPEGGRERICARSAALNLRVSFVQRSVLDDSRIFSAHSRVSGNPHCVAAKAWVFRGDERIKSSKPENWQGVLVFCPGNSLTKSREFLQDGIGGGGPYEGT